MLGLREVAPVGDVADNTTLECVYAPNKGDLSNSARIRAIHGLATESVQTWQ